MDEVEGGGSVRDGAGDEDIPTLGAGPTVPCAKGKNKVCQQTTQEDVMTNA